jgi:HEAT repeat protein
MLDSVTMTGPPEEAFMPRFVRLMVFVPALFVTAAVASIAQQPAKFEDVVRNLRNPDPKIRVSAVRLLRETGYAEAMTPLAGVVNDPVNEIQLEAIDAELSFFLVEPVPTKKRVALIVEVRTGGRAPAAFELGPLAVWPKPVPAELVDALLQAVDDDNKKVRVEAIYALGTIGSPTTVKLSEAATARLLKALDHYDPAVRAGAARVVGRLQVKSAGDALLKAVNDSNAEVRYASIRALGQIDDERAVQALTEQLSYYGGGEGGWAALDALARIAHPSSVSLFQSRLADKDPHLRRAAAEGMGRTADATSVERFVNDVNQDPEKMVRVAMSFALYKKGHPTYLGRLIDFMDSDQVAPQIYGYFMELGPSAVPEAVVRLQDPDVDVRRNLVTILGALGDQSTATALTPYKEDRSRDVATAATYAIERIKMASR